MGCRYSPHRSQSNGKSNFQNELTNQKFDSNSKLKLAYRQHHNLRPITLFHFQKVLQNAKQFRSLKRSHHYRIFMGCHHGTDRAQCWHLAVTCNVKVVIVKTIVIVEYLPYQIIQNYSWGLMMYMSSEADTGRKFWLVLDAISYVTWLMNQSHRRRDHGSNFLTAVTYCSQSNSKLYVQKNNYVPNHPVELAQCYET